MSGGVKFGKKNKKNKDKDKYKLKMNENEIEKVNRALADFSTSKIFRQSHINKVKMLNNYYNNEHYTNEQLAAFSEKYGFDYVPAVTTQPFIQVESQINTVVPSFQFKGRDEEIDPDKAKERQNVVDYVMYRNRMERLLLDNERELNKFGDAYWKVGWDKNIRVGRFKGDIKLSIVSIGELFPDPSVKTINDGEFLIHAYRMHIRKARREFGSKIDKAVPDSEHYLTEILNTDLEAGSDQAAHVNDDTIMIIEYYYRDNEGDIALMIIADEILLVDIPKFWELTRQSGNQMYPIVGYSKTPVLQSLWNKGEIEMVLDLVDAADKELATALLNDAMMANDIVVAPEGACPEDEVWGNEPGAVWNVTQGNSDKVKRLGGVSQNGGLMGLFDKLEEQIQATNGNFDSNQGAEPTRVTTASGLAQLNERADMRKDKKESGREIGLIELAHLIDWMALEFYDDNRIISIQGEDKNADRTFTNFTNTDHAKKREAELERFPDLRKDEFIGEAKKEVTSEIYFPQTDITISAGEGFASSPAFTFQATVEMLQYPITPFNVEVAKSLVDILDLPNKKTIKDSFDKAADFQLQQMQAQMQAQQMAAQAQMVGAQQQQQATPGAEQEATQEAAPLSEAEAMELLKTLPREAQEFLSQMPDDVLLEQLQELSTFTPDEIADYFAELTKG